MRALHPQLSPLYLGVRQMSKHIILKPRKSLILLLSLASVAFYQNVRKTGSLADHDWLLVGPKGFDCLFIMYAF